YAIYIMEIIDTYHNNTIEECIMIGITKLDSALNLDNAQLNFVMSDGSTLWGLCFARPPLRGFSLYYYPHIEVSSFWVAASKPLDTLNLYWAAVPNSTLVILTPGEPPQLISIFNEYETSAVYQGLEIISPNPFKGKIEIRYCIGQSAEGIELKIYDTSGRVVRSFPIVNLSNQNKSVVSVYWDGADDSNRKLPNGIYFCNLSTGDTIYTRKMVLLK
ncbi:T9SS type A sorting domain-containing protein, partial [candidate division WOR-3 bacterium]|nr:T9SS type A sorting domain-containing protein [candidate division WOR-3 bacterium]